MKALFFQAVAGHPNVSAALMGQAENALRPFDQFLRQAINTAEQRQTRYQLPWERVQETIEIKLEPLDSMVRIPRRAARFVLVDWPADREPDLTAQGFVINRSQPVDFLSFERTSDGLLVHTEPPLRGGDQVVWNTIPSSVEEEVVQGPPSELVSGQGQILKLRAPAQEVNEDWVVVVEGVVSDGEYLVDGEKVEVRVLPVLEDLKHVFDSNHATFDVDRGVIRAESTPEEGHLLDARGIRYRWSSLGRRGCWIQLLLPESDDEEALDPRAAFCEGDVREVWTDRRHNNETTYKVKKTDQDRYQLLLEEYPPKGTTLYLPVDVRNLRLQRRALHQLSEAPLPHHQGLLRLCENPEKVRWPNVAPVSIEEWRALKDASRSGTDEQRAFVEKALGTPDFAFLEGPPGSGKTTAICEIVQQLVEDGKRVLLCASTHVAIDNVLERLLESSSPIDAVRIGHIDKVDEKLAATQLDERVDDLVHKWQANDVLKKFGTTKLEEMAERTIIMGSNLTCGTTMGIANHPLFRDRDQNFKWWERPITTMPHWDVMIVDEASKTLIHEFLVPALMAKRWIIVGDVQQLPPFADREDLIANLRNLVDRDNKPVFPREHQRARLLIYRLYRWQLGQPNLRWLIVEERGVLDSIVRELESEAINISAVMIVRRRTGSDAIAEVTVDELSNSHAQSLHVAGADWVLVDKNIFSEIAEYLPTNLLMASQASKHLADESAFLTRQVWWLEQAGALDKPYKDKDFHYRNKSDVGTFKDCQACESDWLSRNDLAQEIVWRLTRAHELKRSKDGTERNRLLENLKVLKPTALSIDEAIEEIQDIGLPSVLEVLQLGIGEDRSKRRSALTEGLGSASKDVFQSRFQSLKFQHRMHEDIAAFSRDAFYDGQALQNANTIEARDKKLDWDFGVFPSRRTWIPIKGREKAGVNTDEIREMERVLREFIEWAKQKGPPARDLPKVWEVACLSFYVKQMNAISDMLTKLTGIKSKTRFSLRDAPVEIVCGTVDRFQGREADLVFLSFRNTKRVGFLDSPNRLNVSLTRARQQVIILGNHDYFQTCKTSELVKLAKETQLQRSEPSRRKR